MMVERPRPEQHVDEGPRLVDREHDYRNTIIAGKRYRSRIHDLEVSREHLLVGEPLVAGRVRVLLGIGGVDAVDLGPFSSASQPISAAAGRAPESVVKNGLPVPPAKITTLFCESASWPRVG